MSPQLDLQKVVLTIGLRERKKRDECRVYFRFVLCVLIVKGYENEGKNRGNIKGFFFYFGGCFYFRVLKNILEECKNESRT